MTDNKIIRVTGRGSIRLTPDLTRLTLSVQGAELEYADTLARSSRETEIIKDTLSGLGFDRSDLKTISFNVDSKYEGYQDENNNWRQRFVGYEFTHFMKLEFPSDNELLGRTLFALAHSSVNAELRIGYTVSDTEAAKNQLLGMAVADARAKAQVLAGEAGVSLGDILSIDYSWGQVSFEVTPVNRMLMADAAPQMAKGSYAMDIQPDDIEVSDTVTVVWGI